jgi:hypothetical protein
MENLVLRSHMNEKKLPTSMHTEPEHVRRGLAEAYRRRAAEKRWTEQERQTFARMAESWERTPSGRDGDKLSPVGIEPTTHGLKVAPVCHELQKNAEFLKPMDSGMLKFWQRRFLDILGRDITRILVGFFKHKSGSPNRSRFGLNSG